MSTYDQLLQVVLQRRPSEKQTPARFVPKEGLVPLRLEVLQDMTFVEDARLIVPLKRLGGIVNRTMDNSHPTQSFGRTCGRDRHLAPSCRS